VSLEQTGLALWRLSQAFSFKTVVTLKMWLKRSCKQSLRLRPDDLSAQLEGDLEPLGLRLLLKPLEASVQETGPPACEPFVITTRGPDRLGLVAGMTEVIAGFGVNITNLRAAFRGGDDPSRNTMIYEVDVPADIDRQSFRQALGERAKNLGLELSLQHRDIFEALHRI